MLRGRTWLALAVGAPLAITLALLPFARRQQGDDGALTAPLAPSLSKIVSGSAVSASGPPAKALAGLDLVHLSTEGGTATAPLPDRHLARLTVNASLQRAAEQVMAMHHIPEAAVVLMDVASGKVLVYASRIEEGPHRDLCVEATAPAASVFKVVTGSSLVENAGLGPDQRECFSGGEQRITPQDLEPDPKRDRWCATLAGAMGRSINTVFARSALRHLKRGTLEGTARSLGFGAALPFDVPVQPSAIRLPDDDLGYARTAAGFWNTTLSPLHAAWLSATIARGGEPVRPVLAEEVVDDRGKVTWRAETGLAQKRALKPATAAAVTTMMESTVSDGTSYRAFHDPKGAAFLAGIPVAGKTGTLTDHTAQRFYTWFTGFAPSHPIPVPEGSDGEALRQVSIGVLVVNGPTWRVKANVLAREVLRAYFASQKAANVTTPVARASAPSKPSTNPAAKSKRTRRAK